MVAKHAVSTDASVEAVAEEEEEAAEDADSEESFVEPAEEAVAVFVVSDVACAAIAVVSAERFAEDSAEDVDVATVFAEEPVVWLAAAAVVAAEEPPRLLVALPSAAAEVVASDVSLVVCADAERPRLVSPSASRSVAVEEPERRSSAALAEEDALFVAVLAEDSDAEDCAAEPLVSLRARPVVAEDVLARLQSVLPVAAEEPFLLSLLLVSRLLLWLPLLVVAAAGLAVALVVMPSLPIDVCVVRPVESCASAATVAAESCEDVALFADAATFVDACPRASVVTLARSLALADARSITSRGLSSAV